MLRNFLLSIPVQLGYADACVKYLNDHSIESVTIMAKEKMPHPGHDKHLCYLNNLGFQVSHSEAYKQLVRNPQFMCKNCGRVAADKKNICNPEEL
jgi:hypothetical protein